MQVHPSTAWHPAPAGMEGIDEADSDSQQRPHPRQGDVKQAQSGQQQMQLPQLRSRRRHLALHHSHAGTEELLRGAQPTTGENDSVAEGLDAADPAGEPAFRRATEVAACLLIVLLYSVAHSALSC